MSESLIPSGEAQAPAQSQEPTNQPSGEPQSQPSESTQSEASYYYADGIAGNGKKTYGPA